jgi:hypothetical protein
VILQTGPDMNVMTVICTELYIYKLFAFAKAQSLSYHMTQYLTVKSVIYAERLKLSKCLIRDNSAFDELYYWGLSIVTNIILEFVNVQFCTDYCHNIHVWPSLQYQLSRIKHLLSFKRSAYITLFTVKYCVM